MADLVINTSKDLYKHVPYFDINKFVYIRGTKEGYNVVAKDLTEWLKNNNTKKEAGMAIIDRYIERYQTAIAVSKNTSLDVVRNYFDGEWVKKQGQAWVTMLDNYIQESFNQVRGTSGETYQSPISETISQTNNAMNEAIKLIKEGTDASVQQINTVLSNVIKDIEKLKLFYQNLPVIVQNTLITYLTTNSQQIPNGTQVNLKQSIDAIKQIQIFIEKIRSQLKALGETGLDSQVNDEESLAAQKTAILEESRRQLATNLGTKGEWLLTFILGEGDKALNKAATEMQGQLKGKVKVSGTTAVGTRTPTAKISAQSKPDEIISYSLLAGENSIEWQVGISQKETGTIIYDKQSKKWKIKKGTSPKIKIFDTTHFANLALAAFPSDKPIIRDNAIYNATVWESSTSPSVRLIKQSIIAHFFDQFIAGSGSILSGTNRQFDLVDCIVINGKPIPVMRILKRAFDQFSKTGSSRYITIQYDAKPLQSMWEPVKDKNGEVSNRKDFTAAQTRSRKVEQLLNKMQTIVNMTANSFVTLMNNP